MLNSEQAEKKLNEPIKVKGTAGNFLRVFIVFYWQRTEC